MEFRPFRVPLMVPFRGVTERQGVLIRGPGGWGEYSPFPDYPAPRRNRWWRAAMEAAAGQWPEPVRERVSVNSIVPAVAPDVAGRLAALGGCRTAKVKVASPHGSIADDITRVEAVRDALGPEGRIRVDANGGWQAAEAMVAIEALDRAAQGLEYVEQPCETLEEMADVRKAVDVPIAADESIRIPEDPFKVIEAEAADIVVLKVAPLGGVQACLDLAERIGLPVVVSGAMETSVGLAAGIALARALPELPYACGLGTGALLAADVVTTKVVPVDGEIAAPDLEVTV